ncbi:hypothetical protein [Actinoplanes sp. L3-i22]|uniref:hypothetical protein n=1 Tax=Actinoplanes sp. L3-i22 TaxID=2836373 RepID=UPI001C8428E5|nr:hypothetical protein [Actinoplanes sp. L3-i22]
MKRTTEGPSTRISFFLDLPEDVVINVEDVSNFLVDRRLPDLPPEALAEVFAKLSWDLDDDANVVPVLRRWLRGDDEYRVAVALWVEDVFPADSRAEIVSLMAGIAARFPALVERADYWIRAWDRAYGSSEPGMI